MSSLILWIKFNVVLIHLTYRLAVIQYAQAINIINLASLIFNMKNLKSAFPKVSSRAVFTGIFALVLMSVLVLPTITHAEVVMGWGSLIASPDTICSGGSQSATLAWDSGDATTLNISPDIGSVAPTGSRQVLPTQTTTYTLTLSNTTGWTGTAHATVYVNGPCQQNNPPTVNLTADQSSVAYNGSTTLRWNSEYTVSCTASGGSNSWSGSKSTAGTFWTGNLTTTQTYSITCQNSSGQTASDSVTVSVGSQTTCQDPSANNYGGLLPCTYTIGSPVIVNLTTDQTNVNYNDGTTVRWTSQNANYCTGSGGTSGWSGSKSLSGSFYTGALTSSITFNLMCSNNFGSDTKYVTISVGGITTNQATVTTNPATNITNTSATLNGSVNNYYYSSNYYSNLYTTTWFEYGPNSGSLYNRTASTSTYGNTSFSTPVYNLSPNTLYYFRAVASTSQGTVYGNILSFYTSGATQTSNLAPSVYVYADDTTLSYGAATYVRWSSQNATSCYASGGSSGWAGNKSIGSGSFYTGALTSARTYYLTCTNNVSSATDSVTVNVSSPTTTTVVRTPASAYLTITSSVDRSQPIVATLDNSHPRPGDEILYTIAYQNVGNGTITNMVLRINLPPEVDYLYSNPSNPQVVGNNLTFNLGSLGANKSGVVTVRVRVRENIAPGTNLNFPATIDYTDPSGARQSVSTNVTAEVFRDGESVTNLGANVFGAGFLPDSLFGWLLLLILILLLILLARYFMQKPQGGVLVQNAPYPPYNPPYPPQQNTYQTPAPATPMYQTSYNQPPYPPAH